MSLTARLAAVILTLVTLFALLGWFAAHRLVVRPMVTEMFDMYLDQVIWVAARLDEGAPSQRLEQRLDLTVQPHGGPIPSQWRTERRGGRQIWFPPGGRRTSVIIETRAGPVSVANNLDLDRPGRRLPMALAVVSVVVILIALAVARRFLVPLRTTTAAMTQMAAGDLGHRLVVSGPTEIASAAAAFNQMADRISSMLSSQRQLMAGISHELRTPLTRLNLEVELLRDAGVPATRLDRMQDDLSQMDDLVGEALDLSRLQLGQTRLVREHTDLRALVLEVSSPGRTFEVVGEGSAECDRTLVERALRNLLQNASKYTPQESPILVHIEPDAIEVRDAGPGVEPDALGSLFVPFFRTRSGSDRADGHGLGLMIVRQVAELHGGHAEARNLNPGLAIRFTLAKG